MECSAVEVECSEEREEGEKGREVKGGKEEEKKEETTNTHTELAFLFWKQITFLVGTCLAKQTCEALLFVFVFVFVFVSFRFVGCTSTTTIQHTQRKAQ